MNDAFNVAVEHGNVKVIWGFSASIVDVTGEKAIFRTLLVILLQKYYLWDWLLQPMVLREQEGFLQAIDLQHFSITAYSNLN